MKYRAGDKFIIEIESRVNNQLYKVKGFNTLVFDERGLDRLEQIHDRLPCGDCEYEDVPYGQEPCEVCCHHHESKYKPKTEDIQVGDEVEHAGISEQERGIVIEKEHDELQNRIWLRVIRSQKAKYSFWSEELCHRTGKTYPELIKALESLPKDGE